MGIKHKNPDCYTFSYKSGNSFVHRLPAWIKLLVIPLLSIIFLNLNPVFILFFLIFQTLLSFYCHFTVKEQLKDLRAVLYYAFFLLIAKLAGTLIPFLSDWNALKDFIPLLPDFFIEEKETGILLLKLLCLMQSASILFKTSTQLEIREGLEKIEMSVRKIIGRRSGKRAPEEISGDERLIQRAPEEISTNEHFIQRAPVAEAVSVFICFIPEVSKNWYRIKTAWYARGGRKGAKMLVVLLPVLFSVGMKDAFNLSKAINVRK